MGLGVSLKDGTHIYQKSQHFTVYGVKYQLLFSCLWPLSVTQLTGPLLQSRMERLPYTHSHQWHWQQCPGGIRCEVPPSVCSRRLTHKNTQGSPGLCGVVELHPGQKFRLLMNNPISTWKVTSGLFQKQSFLYRRAICFLNEWVPHPASRAMGCECILHHSFGNPWLSLFPSFSFHICFIYGGRCHARNIFKNAIFTVCSCRPAVLHFSQPCPSVVFTPFLCVSFVVALYHLCVALHMDWLRPGVTHMHLLLVCVRKMCFPLPSLWGITGKMWSDFLDF